MGIGSALFLSCFPVLLLLWETSKSPWKPFFPATMTFVLFLPLFQSRTFAFLAMPKATSWWIPTLIVFFLALLWEFVVCSLFFERRVLPREKRRSEYWSPTMAIQAIHSLGTTKSKRTADIMLFFLLLIWAPIAEELYFSGLLFPALQDILGYSPFAGILTMGLFAVLHACHFAALRPFPWPAACVHGIAAAGSLGLNLALLMRTQSLYPLFLSHFLINISWAVFMAMEPKKQKLT